MLVFYHYWESIPATLFVDVIFVRCRLSQILNGIPTEFREVALIDVVIDGRAGLDHLAPFTGTSVDQLPVGIGPPVLGPSSHMPLFLFFVPLTRVGFHLVST